MHKAHIRGLVDRALQVRDTADAKNTLRCHFMISLWPAVDCISCGGATTAYQIYYIREQFLGECLGCPWCLKCLSMKKSALGNYRARWLIRICSKCEEAWVMEG